jgi:hypothetical protein
VQRPCATTSARSARKDGAIARGERRGIAACDGGAIVAGEGGAIVARETRPLPRRRRAVIPRPASGERVAVRSARQHAQDRLDHFLGSQQRIVIPRPQHSPTLSLELRGPGSVTGASIGMLPAVELDDQPAIEAREVRKTASTRMLTTKLEPAQSPVPQVEPKPSLGFRFPPSQLTRQSDVGSPHPSPLPARRGEGAWQHRNRGGIGRSA